MRVRERNSISTTLPAGIAIGRKGVTGFAASRRLPRVRHHRNVDSAKPRSAQNTCCVCPERSHSLMRFSQYERFAVSPPFSPILSPPSQKGPR
jgi:hypothetical protein